jgi:hypothetical protein
MPRVVTRFSEYCLVTVKDARAPADDCDMPAIEELLSLAESLGSHESVEDAWAGRSSPMWLVKQCALCGYSQHVRVPFVRHYCRQCSAPWTPVRCTGCATTTIVARRDMGPPAASECACGGVLRPLTHIPRPRNADNQAPPTPAQVAARAWAPKIVRGVALTLAFGVMVGGIGFIHSQRSSSPHAPQQAAPAPQPAVTLLNPIAARGRAAALTLAQRGQHNDQFACQLAYESQFVHPTSATTNADKAADAMFVAACTAVDTHM